MKKELLSICLCTSAVLLLAPSVLMAANGFMGGKGTIVVEPTTVATTTVEDSTTVTNALPGDVEGPLNDNMSSSGKLFGDLYKILRYQGGEVKQVQTIGTDGLPVYDSVTFLPKLTETSIVAVGGEPILSVEYAQYAKELADGTYELAYAPLPSQCVQPVADFNKWGNINGTTKLDLNRIPLIKTYDTTNERTECEVGELLGVTVNKTTGELVQDVNLYFIPPCDDIETNSAQCTWNGVIYCEGVLWTDLVDEVSFGRLNLSRSPEAVLQAAFDEAINAINGADKISRDAAGRLLLTTTVYEELITSDGETCTQQVVETFTKAIDSALENLALYVKLMKDGHLVTPGDERMPIDRSEQGGIPLWKMLELTDGPSDSLRPTIDIDKMNEFGFGNLVDVTIRDNPYYTYYTYTSDADGQITSRTLVATTDSTKCPSDQTCEPWDGSITDNGESASSADFDFAAAFLAAAADKTGEIGVDMVVYINSILGINLVIGTSEDGATDYSKEPYYFDYSEVSYDKKTAIEARGNVSILQKTDTLGYKWEKFDVALYNNTQIPYRYHGGSDELGNPLPAITNILGFTQMADDDLSIISFIHTYQIPELR